MMALVSLLVFSPQFLFIPLMQRATNRRVRERVSTLRQTGAAVIETSAADIAVKQEIVSAATLAASLPRQSISINDFVKRFSLSPAASEAIEQQLKNPQLADERFFSPHPTSLACWHIDRWSLTTALR
jgi:cell pole-organizing protein PopZ